MRIKKYTSLYIHQNRNGGFKKFLANDIVPVKYLFNHHSFCNPEWCHSKVLYNKIDELILSKKNKWYVIYDAANNNNLSN